MIKTLVAFAFLALNFYTYHYLATEEFIPARRTFVQFPLEFGAWRCPQREPMPLPIRTLLGVTDYLICTYSNADPTSAIGVYVGYNATQGRTEGGGNGEATIHPPSHCFPGSGWDIVTSDVVTLDLAGLPYRPAEVKRLIVAKGEHRQLVYYWYQERGRVIAQDWRKIVDLFWDRATLHRTDGALVRFNVPVFRGDEAQADRLFHEFAPQFVAQLPEYIPARAQGGEL